MLSGALPNISYDLYKILDLIILHEHVFVHHF